MNIVNTENEGRIMEKFYYLVRMTFLTKFAYVKAFWLNIAGRGRIPGQSLLPAKHELPEEIINHDRREGSRNIKPVHYFHRTGNLRFSKIRTYNIVRIHNPENEKRLCIHSYTDMCKCRRK